jgi:hypothetical protein
MEFTIRLNDTADAKPFYQMLPSNEHFCFSFLFNATFNQNERLNDYEDGMVCDGYVVGIDESYSASSNKEPNNKQMLLNIKLLLLNTTYIGRDKNYTSIFIHQN